MIFDEADFDADPFERYGSSDAFNARQHARLFNVLRPITPQDTEFYGLSSIEHFYNDNDPDEQPVHRYVIEHHPHIPPLPSGTDAIIPLEGYFYAENTKTGDTHYVCNPSETKAMWKCLGDAA